jgi:hypothetical protein
MTARLIAVIVDCADPRSQALFWSQVLGYEATERNTNEFLVGDPKGADTPLYFMQVPEPKVGKNRLHMDVATAGLMAEEVDRLQALGARLVEVRHDPETLDNPDTWTVMTDPEGNEFCVTSSSTLSGWV